MSKEPTPIIDAAIDAIMVDINAEEIGIAGALARLSVVAKRLERQLAQAVREREEFRINYLSTCTEAERLRQQIAALITDELSKDK